jgi:putative oxidoreductase
MDLIRRAARPMLASVFISGGIDTLRNPKVETQVAGDVPTDIAEAAPVELPQDPETLVMIDAGVKVVGGLLLLSGGRFARIGALACAASLVPTTWAAHRFWEIDDPDERMKQQAHFLKNLSILGGLLIAAADTGGRPSLPWRAGHAAHELKDKASDLLPVG